MEEPTKFKETSSPGRYWNFHPADLLAATCTKTGIPVIDYDCLMQMHIPDVEQSYTERDTMLYALALGYGADPLDERSLHFCYERRLRAAPTWPLALAHPGPWMRDLPTGINYSHVVHGEQHLALHGPIPVSGTVRNETRVVDIFDQGKNKGAIVVFDRLLRNTSDGTTIATMRQTSFCRADGGFGGNARPAAAKSALPETPAHHIITIATRPDTALLYRLSADLNPLHADPSVARAAGFDRPILHGLATFGITGLALLKGICNYGENRIASLLARFLSPFFPGETLNFELWQDDGKIVFRARTLERSMDILRGEAIVLP
jgi:acyl dehydratase